MPSILGAGTGRYGAPWPPAHRSVHRGVVGKRRDERQVAALPAQDDPPEVVRLRGEGVARLGVHDVPATGLDLALQLAGGPPGVTGEDPHARDLGAHPRWWDIVADQAEAAEEAADPQRLVGVTGHGDDAQGRV